LSASSGDDGIIRLSVVSTLSLDKIKRRPSLAGAVDGGITLIKLALHSTTGDTFGTPG
jgi:hypothetical protein